MKVDNGYTTAHRRLARMKRWPLLLLSAAAIGLAACQTTGGPTVSGGRAPARPAPAAQAPAADPQLAALPPAETQPSALESAPTVQRTARVAVLVPLSGEAAAAGLGLRDAALLAQFEVANPGLILQFYDTKGTPDGARAAAEQAKDQGATLFVGPLFSHSVQAVTAVAQSAGIPVLSFSSDGAATSGNVYVTGFLIPPQVNRIVAYAMEQGRSRFAVLAPETAYGRAAADAARAAVERNGGTLVRSAFFDPAKANFSPVIRELTVHARRKAALEQEKANLARSTDPAAAEALKRLEKQETLGAVDFDALLLPVAGTSLRQVISLLKYYDVDPNQVKLLGTLLWQDETLNTEPALVGAWFPAASRIGYDRFVTRFTETYGRAPSQLASLAYDMVALSAALSRSYDTPWRYLTASGGFIGVNGAFRLNPDGQVERMLAVREVSRTGTTVVSPAPTRFGQAF